MLDLACGLIVAGRQISRDDVATMVTAVAANLQRNGFVPGNRVAIKASTSLQTVVAVLGTIRAGMIAVPVNPKLPDLVQRDLLQRFGCSVYVCERGESHDTIDLPSLTFEALLAPSESSALATDMSEDRPAVIVTTSGSTGQSKGVLLNFASLWYSAVGSNQNIAFGENDRWLLSLPLYHVGGLGILFRAIAGKGVVVIPDNNESLAESIEKYAITHLSLVSTQLARLLEKIEKDQIRLPRLKAILLGGSAIDENLIRSSIAFDLPIHTSYGLTEMGSQVTTAAPSEPAERLRTSGRVLPYRELMVDSTGEICVRGRTLFAGYVTGSGIDSPADTDGWFHTGDIGSIDSSGYLTVTGRKDNMFISGGENIHPEEIEAVIRSCPGVEDVLVVPVQSAQWGDRPAAFVRMVNNAPIDLSSLKDVMSDHLPKYKFPEYFFEWPSEVDAALKPSRPYLAALARELVRKLR